ncbi:conserved hypothetical protein, partial [Ricinus communis]
MSKPRSSRACRRAVSLAAPERRAGLRQPRTGSGGERGIRRRSELTGRLVRAYVSSETITCKSGVDLALAFDGLLRSL